MKYSLDKLSAKEWAILADNAHLTVFNETGRSKFDRVDFALLVRVDEELGGYFTCKEMDSETLYIQYGGVFPNFKGTLHTMRGYTTMLNWVRENYKWVKTKIENTNSVMLKMAITMGFNPIGVSHAKNKLFIELSMEV